MLRKILAFLLLIWTLPVMGQKNILIIGDSLSSSHGFESQEGWVYLLAERLKEKNSDYHVINLSVSGDTTSNGLARLPHALEKYKPVITIIELGGNDGLRGVSLQMIRKNLQQMIYLTKEANSQVILLGLRLPPNYGPAYTEQFHQIYVDLARDEDILLVPFFLKGVDDQEKLMQSDRIHPAPEAQNIMLENVWPTLESLL